MIIVKIIELLVLLFVLTLAVNISWKFIKDMRVHNKRMRKLDQWSKFHQQLMDWAKEISDVAIRVDFMNFCANELIKHSNHNLKNDMLDDWNLEEEKMKVYNQWGHHIPSLLQEVRESKLNQLV